jgi:hypothetical protein
MEGRRTNTGIASSEAFRPSRATEATVTALEHLYAALRQRSPLSEFSRRVIDFQSQIDIKRIPFNSIYFLSSDELVAVFMDHYQLVGSKVSYCAERLGIPAKIATALAVYVGTVAAKYHCSMARLPNGFNERKMLQRLLSIVECESEQEDE